MADASSTLTRRLPTTLGVRVAQLGCLLRSCCFARLIWLWSVPSLLSVLVHSPRLLNVRGAVPPGELALGEQTGLWPVTYPHESMNWVHAL